MSELIKNSRKGRHYVAHLTWQHRYTPKHFIQISAVANVVAKEELVQPIGTWPCIRVHQLPPPPNRRVPYGHACSTYKYFLLSFYF